MIEVTLRLSDSLDDVSAAKFGEAVEAAGYHLAVDDEGCEVHMVSLDDDTEITEVWSVA